MNILLIGLLFGPYIYGGVLRLDHLLAAYLVMLFISSTIISGRIVISKNLQLFMILSIASLIYASLRILLSHGDFFTKAQYILQYSYIFQGILIYKYLFKDPSPTSFNRLLHTLAALSITVFVVAFLQMVDKDSEIVAVVSKFYGGAMLDSNAYGEYSNKSQEILDSGLAVSIFVGMHVLAIYSLFMIAVAHGVITNKLTSPILSRTYILVYIVSFATGLLSGSKTFALGFILYLAFSSLFYAKFTAYGVIILIGGSVTVAMFDISYQLRDLIGYVTSGELAQILASRYGQDGYLSEVMHITFETFTLIFGLGLDALNYRYADNQFRQILLIGGFPLFILFYGSMFILIWSLWKNRNLNSYTKPLFILSIVYLLAGVGMDVHFCGRIIPLWIAFTCMTLTFKAIDIQVRSSKNDRYVSRQKSILMLK
jgi:hypothetical protein